MAEKGALGLAVLGDVAGRLDPEALMNPGVLLDAAGERQPPVPAEIGR
jgi:hypothetical protein